MSLSANALSSLAALAQVVLIDVTLAGDNAIVVGLAVRGLPDVARRRAILFGVGAATVIRLALAAIAVALLRVVGLRLAGGVLLLLVAWRMVRELGQSKGGDAAATVPKTLLSAMVQIALADLSMSLDNVLAVAGAAHDHPYILALGLVLSVVLMGIAANLLATLLERHRWIAWVGLAVVVFVALRLIWEGGHEVGMALQ